ncbi:hypothetical protein jhhlp_003628 [Lomentospora prolificans]|uniref:Tuberous sclerosis 1 n=1 Tax=Lomentospora prolificans TaxID=41688 RepID=A0A2N3N9A3_9PEZI|nr:hypothetical protein jhhlp_003628 [Lomentospora prolificans]
MHSANATLCNRTLKSLSKAINNHIGNLAVPLPDDLDESIKSYLNRHEKHDDSSAERLQEELISIYQKHVRDRADLLAGFVAILSKLVPIIKTSARILQWWDLLKDKVEEHFSTEKGLMSEASSAIQGLLALDDVGSGDEGSDPAVNPYAERLLRVWVDSYQASPSKKNAEPIERSTREFFVKAEFRVKTATLLCDFIEQRPPHLYQVLQTPLFNTLLKCLQLDTSTTVVSATLMALTMLLPHMPSSLVPHLPTLFNIYARLLFWHRERSSGPDFPGEKLDRKPLIDPSGWEECEYRPDLDDNQVPSLRNYFTILYGLYPINFMDYIRKPHRFLRHANAPNADAIEVQPSEIRHQSEEFRRGHLLHPNFYNLTIDSEKTDHGRWQSSEPAEVVAECTALCVMTDPPIHGALPGQLSALRTSSLFSREDATRDGPDSGLLGDPSPGELIESFASSALAAQRHSSLSSQQSLKESVDGRHRSLVGDSPTLPPHLSIPSLHAPSRGSALNQTLPNDSVPSLSLSQQESTPEGVPQAIASSHFGGSKTNFLVLTGDPNAQISQLRRQVLLLQNDLAFERYLKQQHITHMAELRRRQMKEAASEADLQNLIIANRNWKSGFEEAKKAEMQARKESEKVRSLAKKWEADLAAKLKTSREETKKTKAKIEELERDFEAARKECDKLKTLVCEYEVRELNWKQSSQSHELDKSEIDRLKAEVARLTVVERDFQGKEAEMERAVEAASDAESQVDILNQKLVAQENALEQVKKLYESQIVVLKSKLVEAQESVSNGKKVSPAANLVFENTLAASRAKQAELQKQYSLLMRKYTILQSSLLDMRCDPSVNPAKETGMWSDGDGEGSPPMSSSPSQPRGRIQRVFTSPDAFATAGSSYNAISPLDPRGAGSSGIGSPPVSLTPLAEGGVPLPVMSQSPEPRFHGRGGVQNRIRKEGKDKKAQEGDKKDKKTGGLRGIRNLV